MRSKILRRASLLGVSVLLIAAALSGCGSSADQSRTIAGPTGALFGSPVATFAQTGPDGRIALAGLTITQTSFESAPGAAGRQGAGPAGAVLVIDFPDEVRQTTFLNHVELHWEEHGHPPEKYSVPHWDLHFYGIPEAQVRQIAPGDTIVPDPQQVPQGWSQPANLEEYQANIVPQMGYHSVFLADFLSQEPFTATPILGYHGGNLIFVEPMFTQAVIRSHTPINLTFGAPSRLSRTTLFPRHFNGTYNAAGDNWTFTLSDFVTIPGP